MMGDRPVGSLTKCASQTFSNSVLASGIFLDLRFGEIAADASADWPETLYQFL